MDGPAKGLSSGPRNSATFNVQDSQIATEDGVQAHGQRGVWTPAGMTAAEIMHGAAVLERKWKIDHYQARSMVRAVLRAIRLPAQKGTP